MNVWKSVLLNRSGRPILEEGEHNLYVREDIGLYQGKSKVINRQNGRVYITNQRIIYVDSETLDNSLCVLIKEIVKLESSEGFLRSSPKVKLFFKNKKGGEVDNSESSSISVSTSSNIANERWICMICTFSNIGTASVCASCGIRKMELKALSSQSTGQSAPPAKDQIIEDTATVAQEGPKSSINASSSSSFKLNACPACTFLNHSSMKYCEICGTELPKSSNVTSTSSVSTAMQATYSVASPSNGSSSSLPINLQLEDSKDMDTPYIKFSFRKGGEEKFRQILDEQLELLKWEQLVFKGNINKNGTKLNDDIYLQQESNNSNNNSSITNNGIKSNGSNSNFNKSNIGIHGLEQIGEQQRKLNELVLTSSLEDLEQLMYKAKDLIKLSASFSNIVKPIPVTEQLIPPLNITKTSKLFHRELSRNISEYLHTITLTKTSSMITLQDLFAHYNRYLSSTQGFGTELISDVDLSKAIELFNELKLPFKKKKYDKSGLVVITPNLTNDYSKLIKEYIEKEKQKFEDQRRSFENFKIEGIDEFVEGSDIEYFKGKSVSEIAESFSWSYSIAEEEIETCVSNGTLVIDQNITGTYYFLNEF
ncbi:vacuolar protein-sorting-associated protein 36 [[Candida] railenensis]|uniref:Vacuolar protein-sorting-associated protein 36 n=1 Tax=[Candida] railenensis TaxID=45579 RepID=A0A9P0QMQ0_9ASCO|nr:vacuolar protein-sorting-associated protein 36 [[Candida] railenensis]